MTARASDSMFYPLTMCVLQIVFMIMIISLWRSIVVRTLVSAGELSLSCARLSDYLAVKPSPIGQPTWPTQPSIHHRSVNE